MIDRMKIRKFCQSVAREFRPRKIILFGSYAYGRPTRDSDVDLLVIMPYDKRRGRMSVRIRQTVPRDFPLDLLVRTPAEVGWNLRWGDPFTAEILSKGKIMYEADYPPVDQKG